MQTEFIAVPPDWNVGQAIDYMRETADLPDRFYELYVVDAAGKLLGAVALDRLLRTKRPVPVTELMDEDRRKVRATEDQEKVARQFERYNLVAAPVVDEDDRLVGVLTFDDIVDVIEQEAEEDIKALGGVSAYEELSDSVWDIVKARFPWLLANLGCALVAAWVIAQFSSSIEKMVALAVLMPIVASMGGNAGTQTMTVAVRALATRELSDANAWRVVRRELLVGIFNGIGFRHHHRRGRCGMVRGRRPVPGHGAGDADGAGGGGAWRHRNPAGADEAWRRSGGIVWAVRDHHHRRRRLLLRFSELRRSGSGSGSCTGGAPAGRRARARCRRP